MHLYEFSQEEQKELIGIEDGEDKIKYPTLVVCSYCEGYAGIVRYGKDNIEDPVLAYEVALIRFGHSLNEWGSNVANRNFIPEPCNCICPETGEPHDSIVIENDEISVVIECKDCGERVKRGYK